MRIKKVSQTTPVTAQVVDGYSTSTTDAYSANYVNNMQIGTSQIANGAVTSDKIASGAVPTITMTTTDPGEGASLAANSFIGVYE